MANKTLNIAIVGLGFGAEFIPIYQKYPGVELVAICQRNKSKLDEIGNAFGIAKRYTDYDELLKDADIHAVHINTPIPDHGVQSIKALKAGKHVACTVPMATTVEECEEIVRLTKEKNLTYMMMETVVYAREFLFMKELYEKGELGKVQFIKASPPARHGWLAELLAGAAAHVLRNSLRGPGAGTSSKRGGVCVVFRIGHDTRRLDQTLQFALCSGNHPC